MKSALHIILDDVPVRFTPEGKVAVFDALQALFDTDHPGRLWKTISDDRPELLDLCDYYSFDRGNAQPVVDSQGWNMLWNIFPEYLFLR